LKEVQYEGQVFTEFIIPPSNSPQVKNTTNFLAFDKLSLRTDLMNEKREE
jgi:hypothetical protein